MTGIIKTSSCMDQIFFWLLTGKTRLLPADSNDLFKVTLDDLDLAIAKNSQNFIGSFCWATEFGLLALLVG